jgi:hypothetical protein
VISFFNLIGKKMNGKVIKIMLINFLIWLVPTALFLALSFAVMAILMMAASDVSSGSRKKDPFEKWPMGFIGSLGIGFLLVCLASLASFFYFENMNGQDIVFIVGIAVVCALFGYWGVKYDYRRLSKKLELV